MFSQRTVTSASLALKLSLIYIELIKSSSRDVWPVGSVQQYIYSGTRKLLSQGQAYPVQVLSYRSNLVHRF